MLRRTPPSRWNLHQFGVNSVTSPTSTTSQNKLCKNVLQLKTLLPVSRQLHDSVFLLRRQPAETTQSIHHKTAGNVIPRGPWSPHHQSGKMCTCASDTTIPGESRSPRTDSMSCTTREVSVRSDLRSGLRHASLPRESTITSKHSTLVALAKPVAGFNNTIRVLELTSNH